MVAWSGLASDGVAVADVATGRVIDRLHQISKKDKNTPAQPFAFSPDGKVFATGGEGRLRVWDLSNGKETVEAEVGDFDRCVFSPDRKTVAVAGSRFVGLRLIEVSTGKPLPFPAVRPAPHCLAFCPDGVLLAGGDEQLVRVWEVATGKEIRRIPWTGRAVFAVAFSPDGRTVVGVSRDGQFRSWAVGTGKEGRTFSLPFSPGERDTANRLALSADLRWLAVAPLDKRIRLVDLNTGREMLQTASQPGRPFSTGYAFTPDSKHLVAPSSDGRLLVWEARTGKLVQQGSEDARSVIWLFVTPNGKQILTLSYDRKWADKVRLDEWEFSTCKRLSQRELTIRPGRVILSPDGRYLACGEINDSRYRAHKTGDLVVIDRTTGQEVRHFDDGKPSAPQALAYTPDGRKLATISREGIVRIWDAGTGKLLHRLEAGGSPGLSYEVRFLDGGKTLVSLSMKYDPQGQLARLIEWDVATGKEKKSTEGPTNMGWCHQLSPDGGRLAWAGGVRREQREEVQVWDVASRGVSKRFEGLHGGPTFLLYSPDGRTLATGSADDTILIWDVSEVKKE
jgi:WD40 repeat protein